MLFKADISGDALTDENKLCEQLYIFLYDYVRRRLTYENSAEIEDCVQDTIMFLISRYRKLTPEQKAHINIEQFFYNRANSRVSFYLRNLKKERGAIREYSNDLVLLGNVESNNNEEYINMPCLNKVLDKYRLDSNRYKIFKKFVINKLVSLGYNDSVEEITYEELDKYDHNNVLDILSYSAVDEYLVKSVKEAGELDR